MVVLTLKVMFLLISEIIDLINDYNVIRDGEVIVLQALEQVYLSPSV